jgi:hypothetical protein
VAIAVASSVAWAFDEDYDAAYTSATFSPAAGTVIVVAAYGFDTNALSITNSGTALSWNGSSTRTWVGGSTANEAARVFYAVNSSAQSNITVTVTCGGGSTLGFQSPGCTVYVLSGVNTSSPAGDKGTGTVSGTSGNITGTGTTGADGDWFFAVGVDAGVNGSLASSNGTINVDGAGANKFALYREFATAGSSYTMNVSRGGSSELIQFAALSIAAAAGGPTSHDATAARATTVTATAAAALTVVGGATASTTATLSAAVAVERAAAATLASAVTLAAEATVERSTEASLSITATPTAGVAQEHAAATTLSSTATLTAAADVETPGSVDITATLPITTTADAVALLERIAAATVATTATLTAAADATTPGSHDATGSVSVTATLTAAANVERSAAATLAVTSTITVVGFLNEETTRGLMAGIERAASTMTPITGAGSPPRRVSLLSIDTATMTALVSLTEVPGLGGVPVFIGGDESPLAAGLVGEGEAYLWISDGVVYYEDGS